MFRKFFPKKEVVVDGGEDLAEIIAEENAESIVENFAENIAKSGE